MEIKTVTFGRGKKGDATNDVLSTKETTMIETPGVGGLMTCKFMLVLI